MRMWIRGRILLLLTAVLQILPAICLDTLDFQNNGCNETHDSEPRKRLNVEFASAVVDQEYIVTFTGYYSQATRRRYLTTALNSSDVMSWKIIDRDNPAYEYPSDFDVVTIHDNHTSGLKALKDHPVVKTVSPHRKVTRTLKYVNEAEKPCDSSDTISSILRNRNRQSLSLATAYWHSPSRKNRNLLRAVPKQIASALQAEILWNMGYTGEGVRVAIFDTGLAENHPHFKHGRVKDRTNWTNEKTLDDGKTDLPHIKMR